MTLINVGGSIGDVTVTWQVSSEGQTAVLNEDFVADGATLNFIQGENRRSKSMALCEEVGVGVGGQYVKSLLKFAF